jgi:hypothetical protein
LAARLFCNGVSFFRGFASSFRSFDTTIFISLLHAPIEHIIVLEAFTDKQIAEQLAKVRIIGLIIEAESTAVVEEDSKLIRETAAEEIGRGSHLLLHDSVVLLLLGGGLETLPWESTAKEVHENVGQRFQIVTSGLFNTQVRVDGGVTSSTSQVLVLTIRDVQVSLGVTVLLGETEIDNVDLVATLANTHQEIVRLNVTVDKVARVDVLDTGDQLIGKEQDGLQRELAVAEVEQVLKRGTKEIEDHGVVVALSAEPSDERHSDTTSEGLVDFGFIFKLRVLCLDGLELDGDFLSRNDVNSEINVTEGSRTDLLSKTVLASNTEVDSVGGGRAAIGHLVVLICI